MPERMRKIHVFDWIGPAGRHSSRSDRIAAVTRRITIVRMKVARFELMPSTPILPNRAVRPAKNAEPSANRTQLSRMFMHSTPRTKCERLPALLHVSDHFDGGDSPDTGFSFSSK